jgi:tripartite-type tricarboxylate transporter receptor subunit TctC
MFARTALLALTVMGLVSATSPGSAQDKFPSRNIRLIVPFAAGGGVDTIARLVAERMQAKLGVTVLVENRPGGNGTIGGSAVMQSAPDGYTLLVSSNTHTMAKFVLASPPYDPAADFTPVVRLGEVPLLAVIAPKLPQNTLAEIAAAAQKEPNKWTAGVPALGSPGHLATLSFAHLTNTKLTITPYKGTAPALNDVVGGHIQLLFDSITALHPQVKAGGVKGIAITTAKRSKLAPDIPTAAESGVPGLSVVPWFAMWGAKGTPADIVKVLNETANGAIQELAASGKLAAVGIEPINESSETFAKFAASEAQRAGELLKAAGFKPQ